MKYTNEQNEMLHLLNGCEVHSLTYEGCVGIEANKVLRRGKVIDVLNTTEKLQSIWVEYCQQNLSELDYEI